MLVLLTDASSSPVSWRQVKYQINHSVFTCSRNTVRILFISVLYQNRSFSIRSRHRS